MMAIGGLLALLCGGCTLLVVFVTISSAALHGSMANINSMLSVSLIPVVVGGAPAALGAALFWSGLKRFLPPPQRRKVEQEFD